MACVRLYNLDVANRTFSGCIKIEFHLFVVTIKSIDLGCFHIPLDEPPSESLLELVRYVTEQEETLRKIGGPKIFDNVE